MIGHLLNQTVTVYRASFTGDGRGGRTKAMASAGTIRVKLSQPSPVERQVAEQQGATLDYVAHTAYGAGVERGDELDDDGPRRLRVVSVVHNSHRTYTRLGLRVIEA